MFNSTQTTLRSSTLLLAMFLIGTTACGDVDTSSEDDQEANETRTFELQVFEAADEPELTSCELVKKVASLTPRQIAEARAEARRRASRQALFTCSGVVGQGVISFQEDSLHQAIVTKCLDGEGKHKERTVSVELYAATASIAYTCTEVPPVDRVKAKQEATVFPLASGRPQPLPFASLDLEVDGAFPDCADEGCCVDLGGGEGYCADRHR